MSQISGITDEDSKYEVFINAIKDATRVATGTKRCDAHRKKSDGNTKRKDRIRRKPSRMVGHMECKEVIENRITARNVYRADRSTANGIELKRCTAVARKVLRIKKRENFKRFANSLNRFVDVGFVRKKWACSRIETINRLGVRKTIKDTIG